MFIYNWACKALGYLGLWSKNAKILFLGLDNAGKTTMLHMLKDAKLSSHQPTNHPNMEELRIGDLRIQAHDLGGHRSARRLWNDYLTGVDAIIYMIDAYDRERFAEAKSELEVASRDWPSRPDRSQGLLSAESLAHVPFLILGNKIDLPHAASEDELRYALAIDTTGKVPAGPGAGADRRGQSAGDTRGIRPIEIFPCSVVKKFGYGKGFEWLSSYIK